jgi:hypothetical protein
MIMEPTATNSKSVPEIEEIDPHDGDVDVSQLWHMLSMTPAERLDYHDAVWRSALEMHRVGRRRHGITGYDCLDPEFSSRIEGSGSWICRYRRNRRECAK